MPDVFKWRPLRLIRVLIWRFRHSYTSQAGQLGRNKLGGKEICRQSREKTALGQPRRETNAKFSARRDGITSNLPYSGSLISQAPPLKYTGFPGVRSIRSDFQGLNRHIQSPPLNCQPSKKKYYYSSSCHQPQENRLQNIIKAIFN